MSLEALIQDAAQVRELIAEMLEEEGWKELSDLLRKERSVSQCYSPKPIAMTSVEEMAASYVEAFRVSFSQLVHTNSEAGPWVGVVAYACLEGFYS